MTDPKSTVINDLANTLRDARSVAFLLCTAENVEGALEDATLLLETQLRRIDELYTDLLHITGEGRDLMSLVAALSATLRSSGQLKLDEDEADKLKGLEHLLTEALDEARYSWNTYEPDEEDQQSEPDKRSVLEHLEDFKRGAEKAIEQEKRKLADDPFEPARAVLRAYEAETAKLDPDTCAHELARHLWVTKEVMARDNQEDGYSTHHSWTELGLQHFLAERRLLEHLLPPDLREPTPEQ